MILKTERASEVKKKAFFIMFEKVSFAKKCLRPASLIRFVSQGFKWNPSLAPKSYIVDKNISLDSTF